MTQYMLDTNTVSHLVKRREAVVQRLAGVPVSAVCVSAITAGELRFGLAKLGLSRPRQEAVGEFLRRAEILPWTAETAEQYGVVRASMERRGVGLGPLDMLIAAHALSLGAILVTSDRAFSRVPDLQIEDWTA